MIKIDFGAHQVEVITKKLKNLDSNIVKNLDAALYLSANHLRNVAVRMISSGTRTGNSYKRTKSGLYHRASAAGEPPKRDRGGLESSLHASKLKPEMGSYLNYAAWLEDGTSNKDGTPKMEPRPYLAPTLKKSEKAIEKFILSALERPFK
jgi:hypothetical protein